MTLDGMTDGDKKTGQESAPGSDRLTLLGTCRRLIVDGVGSAFAELRFHLLDASVVREAHAPDLATQADLADRWPKAEASFRQALGSFFDEQVRFAESSRLGKGYDFSASSLHLLDDAELEFSIELDDTRQHLRTACEGDLYALDLRIAHLLNLPEIEEDYDPVGVAAVLNAVRQAIEQLDAVLAVRVWVLRVVEQKLEVELPAVYARVNDFLVAGKILPKISSRIRRRDDRGAAGKVQPPEPGRIGDSLAPGAVPRLAPETGRPGAAASGVIISDEEIAKLNATLQSLLSVQNLGDAYGRDGGERFLTLGQALHSSSRAGADSAPGAGPEWTRMDLVAALFRGILEDKDMPATIKSLLGWLQIPMLKVAMTDPAFSLDGRHPALRLLDTLARISACLDGMAGEDHAISRAIKRMVLRIRDEFDRDSSIFEQVLAEFNSDLGCLPLPGGLPPEAANAVVARYRRRIQTDPSVANVIEPALLRDAPAVVREFLDGPWRSVLTRTRGKLGEDHADWRAFVKVVEDLLWSVEPKTGADSRRQLVAVLPGLVKQLNKGLDSIEAPQADRVRFLDALVALHSASMKSAVAPGATPDATRMAAAPAVDTGRSSVSSGPGGEDDGFVLNRQTIGGIDVISVHRPTEMVGYGLLDVARGDCIEFRLPRLSPQRACLCWDCSGENDVRVLVFAAADSHRAFVVSAALLVSLLRAKLALWVGRNSLVERSFAGMRATVRTDTAAS